MTQYTVQYLLPVNNPVSNVSAKRSRDVIHFSVPLNHPDAHSMGFMDLIAAAELSGKLDLLTTPNTDRVCTEGELSVRKAVKKVKAELRLPPPACKDRTDEFKA